MTATEDQLLEEISDATPDWFRVTRLVAVATDGPRAAIVAAATLHDPDWVGGRPVGSVGLYAATYSVNGGVWSGGPAQYGGQGEGLWTACRAKAHKLLKHSLPASECGFGFAAYAVAEEADVALLELAGSIVRVPLIDRHFAFYVDWMVTPDAWAPQWRGFE